MIHLIIEQSRVTELQGHKDKVVVSDIKCWAGVWSALCVVVRTLAAILYDLTSLPALQSHVGTAATNMTI